MFIRAFIFLLLPFSFSAAVYAQLPELSLASKASGASTTARFFGGASRDNGEHYASEFDFEEKLDIDFKVDIEPAHRGSSGNLYLIVLWNNTYFIRDATGTYKVWDLQLKNLEAVVGYTTLTSSITLNFVDDIAFGPLGVSGGTLKIYVAYDTAQSPSEMIYTSEPLSVVINSTQTSANCARALYSNFPAPSSTDSVHRYYNFFWQREPFLCTNVYGDVPHEISSKVRAGLQFSIEKLGLLAPFNGFLLNYNLDEKDKYISDTCDTFTQPDVPKSLCVKWTPPLENGRAGGGAGHTGIFNGGGSENSVNAYWEQSVFWQEAGFPSKEDSREWYANEIAKVSVHEFFHAHQQTLMWYFEDRKQFGIPISLMDDIASYRNSEHQHDEVFYSPTWIEEGFAEFAAHVLMQQYNPNGLVRQNIITMFDLLLRRIAEAKSLNDIVSLGDYEYETKMDLLSPERNVRGQFDLGEWAAIYLWHRDESNLQGIMVDYWKNWGEEENSHPREGWRYSFEKTFGQSIEDFYVEFDEFMTKPRDEILSILKTSEQVRMATFTAASR